MRFLQGINIGVVAVPNISQLLHQMIVVVALPESECRQRDTALALLTYQIEQ